MGHMEVIPSRFQNETNPLTLSSPHRMGRGCPKDR